MVTIKKLLSILEKSFRRKAFILQFYLVIGVIFESIGLGLIIPLVNVITDVNSLHQNGLINYLKNSTGNISNSRLVFIVLAGFAFFYFVKTMFLTFLVWKQSEFTQGLSRNVSTRLFRSYLFQPYSFFMDKNSGVLMKNVISEVSAFTAYVQGVMFLQTEISVLTGIVVTLLFLEPFGAMVVFSFVGGVGYLMYSFSKNKISIWGKDRQKYDGLRAKNLLQGLNGVSELKLFHKENYFLNKYDRFNKFFYDSQRRVQFMQQAQRFYIELVLIISIVILALVVIIQGKSIGAILPSLSLFLFASLRLLPSTNRIIASLQTMRFTKPGVDLVHDELKNFQSENNNLPVPSGSIVRIKESICLKNINYTYPSAQHKSLDSINFEIRIGSVVGIIGQSGSGKTTLANIITGLLQPISGQLLVDNVDITLSVYELQKFIGYVPQNIFLIDDTLKRNIAFGIPDEEIDLVQLAGVIEASQLGTVVEKMPEGIETIVGERGIKLSGGQRQRIGIARALYNNPEILILDEGTSALDTETENYIMEAVAHLKGKLTILLIAHRYSTLHFCDIVYKMQNGLIISKGKLEELV